jgi:hypothetical protein
MPIQRPPSVPLICGSSSGGGSRSHSDPCVRGPHIRARKLDWIGAATQRSRVRRVRQDRVCLSVARWKADGDVDATSGPRRWGIWKAKDVLRRPSAYHFVRFALALLQLRDRTLCLAVLPIRCGQQTGAAKAARRAD